ncbi:RING/U-box [Guyanagaster necrorhizus]|uniref:RING/U-box n=1 Tax=Guyanagaster necrorhizus TaxID=856835 RepID=A0A9P7W0B3_9AGAR|nr:RING/U-box [Guyanagaster necrorhizus MCA 3950]KAG7450234.1 RING/U-box [Guyanagaster necrorhizus MCA 3950]
MWRLPLSSGPTVRTARYNNSQPHSHILTAPAALPLSQRDLNTDSSTGSLQSGKGKRPRNDSQSRLPCKKGKMKAHNPPQAGESLLNSYLKAYHADLECPICQDFLVAAHVCVPCGHSFCGECLSQWVEVKRDCPSCRGKLNAPRMVPNVAINSLVETYLDQLACTEGNEEWKRRRSKYAEREARKKKWKSKLQEDKRHRVRAILILDSDEDSSQDESYDSESEQLVATTTTPMGYLFGR